jgi:MFS transporter, DHA1 family, tetracycline resistance protein
VPSRFSDWLARWSLVLPLLAAEGVIALGFGAILPILSIFYTQHGVDLPELGVVVAAWPAARLFSEPLFGRLADHVSRKWIMVVALVVSAVAGTLPVAVSGPMAFIALRAIAGLAAAAYDPAARGYLMDVNPPERQGETFGLYGSAQMGGFMVGPAVGGLAAAITGEPTVVFWVFGLAYLVSAVVVMVRVADVRQAGARPDLASSGIGAEAGHERLAGAGAGPGTPAGAVAAPGAGPAAVVEASAATPRPPGLLNRLLVVALVVNVGAYLASGTYEVIWSVYMDSLGASFALIGLSFFTFSLPVLVLSPFTGRFVDREGGFLAVVVGGVVVAACGVAYLLIPSVWWMIGLGLVEGTAAAFSSPALYLLVARAAPSGRSSTAQGLFGAAGTSGTIVASLAAGVLASVDLRLPFIAMGLAMLLMLAVGLAIGGRVLWDALQPRLAPGLPQALEEPAT